MNEGRGPDRRVVAVFADPAAAKSAADAVRGAGVDQTRIRVGDQSAEVAALRGEMREEMEHTMVGPGNVGPFTKEMSKGVVGGVVIGTVIGVVVCLPLALIEFADVSLPGRLLIAAIVGAFAGATLGFVMGGGLGAKGPGEPLAAERGVTVAVEASDPEEAARVADVLKEREPIRLDAMLADGQPADTVTTEEDRP